MKKLIVLLFLGIAVLLSAIGDNQNDSIPIDPALGFGNDIINPQDTPSASIVRSIIPYSEGFNKEYTQKNRFQQDNKGTEFWLCFEKNHDNSGISFQFFIASDVNTSATISIPYIPWEQTVAVAANNITTVDLPNASILSSELIEDKGIHIVADDEITVYGLSIRGYSTDAYLALPVDILNVSYMIMSYQGRYGKSQFAIVSPYDGVNITITPSDATYGGQAAGVPFNITLNEGQTYQVQSYGDLTGSTIQSTLPIAVFSGVECANIPYSYVACDHIIEQLPPMNTWGSSFVSIPLEGRENGDTWRMIASQDGTDLSINSVVVATLNFGDFYETILDQSAYITSTNPVMVMQFANGDSYDPNIPSNGDPFMMLIPPTEQFMDSYSFSTPSTGFPVYNYVSVTIETSGIGTLLLDGVSVDSGLFDPIGSTGYSGAGIPVSIGSHHIESNIGIPFGIYSYGFNAADSYGYPGGLSLEFINSGAGPVIVRTQETIELSDTSQDENVALNICAYITDEEEPFVESAALFYRLIGNVTYTEVAMVNVIDDTWCAEIPAMDVLFPGVQYYIYATDGQLSSTNPAINPSNNPYDIPVGANEPPVIIHTPMVNGCLAEDVSIEAEITDETLYVDSAELLYRITGGNPVYTSVPMALTRGHYEATIPGADVTMQGLEYYLRATDNYGLSSTSASANNPHEIVVEDCNVPVTLSSFTAVFDNSTPTLQWTTQSESNNLGWNIYRSLSENMEQANQINDLLIPGNGTTTEPTQYVYTDISYVENNTTYWYWLESASYNGETELYGPVTLAIQGENQLPELPTESILHNNYPNPFNPSTMISFSINAGETGSLTILNTKGQVMETHSYEAGEHQFNWDATQYSSGIYFYKLETQNYTNIKKMIMVK